MPVASYGNWIRERLLEAPEGMVPADLFRGLREEGRTRATYNSFIRFFSLYRLLGYVERTDRTEPSYTRGREGNPEAFVLKPRIHFRITPEGREAPDWSNPNAILYPEWSERIRENARRWREKKKAEGLISDRRGRPRKIKTAIELSPNLDGLPQAQKIKS